MAQGRQYHTANSKVGRQIASAVSVNANDRHNQPPKTPAQLRQALEIAAHNRAVDAKRAAKKARK